MTIKIFIKKLNSSNFTTVLKEFLPTRYQSNHEFPFLKIKKGNFIYLMILSFILINLYFFKILWKLAEQKRDQLSENYKLLVYIPNYKYERFFNNIFEDSDRKSILTISDDVLSIDFISKYSFFDSRYNYIKEVLMPSYVFSLKACYKDGFQSKKSQVDFLSILHLMSTFTQSFFLIYLSKQTQFKKIFSLHPNGDLHYLIRMTFLDEMHSIRPDTTTYSEEHRYIKSDYLYYKSEYEREVYSSFNIKTTLVKGGYLYENIFKPKDIFNDLLKILFIDTCTNVDVNSAEIRRKAIADFYEVFSLKSDTINLYHKFHPGLLKEERLQTMKLIDAKSVKVLDVLVDLREFDMVIGFYSTLYHDVLCSGICFVELSGEYNTYPDMINPLMLSPISKINSKNDFIIKLHEIEDNIEGNYSSEIWNWYYETYNIPEGKVHLKNRLLV